jgi:hypothetical protein
MAAGSSIGMGGGMTDPLLSQLEALTGPSHEIDAEIALANGWRKNPGGLCWLQPDGRLYDFPPRYTASIDAALTLAPADMSWQIGRGISGYYARMGKPHFFEVEGPTPAIALLIAIMKAKEGTIP